MERLRRYGQLAGQAKVIMTESNYYQKISAYLAKNKRRTAAAADIQNMGIEAIDKKEIANPEGNHSPSPCDGQTSEMVDQRLDAIYDQEPLGFEKDPESSSAKMLAQDPLEEVDIIKNLCTFIYLK